MVELVLLAESKQTLNKVRWDCDVDGTPFELYIPKWRVPEPWPRVIEVTITEHHEKPATQLPRAAAGSDPRTRGQRIVTHIRKFRSHTQTIRYRPDGESNEWEIGEPYVPIPMTFQGAERLTLEVVWRE